MKIIYLGTPEISANVLRTLIQNKFEIVAVVSQEDKPVGRKQILEKTPTKIVAEKNNIPCFQFKKIRVDGVETLKKLNADIMVTCAYGQILSQEIIDICPKGIINLHGSILPKYRGSSPVQWAIINGEKETGVTIAQTEKGLDCGEILNVEKFNIEEDDNAITVFEKMATIGSKLLMKTLNEIENNVEKRVKQKESEMTYFPMLKKEDGKIDFSKSAKEICNQIRGMIIWPTAYFELNNKSCKIFDADVVYANEKMDIGEVLSVGKNGTLVQTGNGLLNIKEIQFAGEKRIKAIDIFNGKKLKIGDKLN